MPENLVAAMHAQVIEESVWLTRAELSHACGLGEDDVVTLVLEGVLEPVGQQPQDWQFGGLSLRRARMAQRLTSELELNLAGVALVLELLDQIDDLNARLRRNWKS